MFKEKLTTSSELEELIQTLRDSVRSSKTGPKVKATKTLGTVALIYERFRNSVEYHEEHLLRKNAIARALRRLLSYYRENDERANLLVDDLIRAGYFKNETISEETVEQIKASLEKYQIIFDQIARRPFKDRQSLYNWILGIMACEIEDLLVSSAPQEALIKFATPFLTSELEYGDFHLSEDEKNLQLYIVMNKVLYKTDREMLRYRVLKKVYPEWTDSPPLDLINQIAVNFEVIKTNIDEHIDDSFNDVITRKLRRYAIIFWVLNDVLVENIDNGALEELLSTPLELETQIKAKCEERYKSFGSKLRRNFIRTIIYLLLTKTVLAFILELPYDIYMHDSVVMLPFVVNIVFHPILMLIIGASVRTPSPKNTAEIVNSIFKLAYQERSGSILYKSSRNIKPHPLLGNFFNVLYTLGFLVTFGVIVFALYRLGFNWLGGTLFVFFLTAVSFFGIRLRYGMRELGVLPSEGNLFTAIIDFFSIPVISAGKWIASKLPKINFFVFVLDRIIEAPLKSLIPVLDHWISYVRDKKDEIY